MAIYLAMFSLHTLQITPEQLALIGRIDEFKGTWRALGTLAPERLTVLKKVATIESIGSSTRIEGSRLSDREVEHLLANLQVQRFASRDEQEVGGYAQVMALVFDAWQDLPPSENHIRQLHRDLLIHSSKDAWHRGGYKTSANSVVALSETGKQIGVVFETATPFDTPRLMTELVEWFELSLAAKVWHPLMLIGVWVVVFLEIHPFQDGNGRLSRVLTTLLLLRAGYAYVPYSSLEAVIERSKEAYYLALRQTQGTIRSDAPGMPNWQPWITYFLRALAKQTEHLAVKMEREQLLHSRLPVLSAAIVDLARQHGRVTVSEAVALTGSKRDTVKLHLRKLVASQHLAQFGAGRGVWYGFALMAESNKL
jgi:Fic family protein